MEKVLADIRLGEVRLIRCEEVTDLLARLRIWGDQERDAPRVVLCNWEEAPPLDDAVNQVLDALARTALAIWPNWYGAARGATPTHPRPTRTSVRGEISAAWLRAAANRCRKGQPPRLGTWAHAIQAAQLALAIAPQRLHVVLALSAERSAPDRLMCFARVAEWLAKETQTRVAVVIPSHLTAGEALDSISFGAVGFSPAPADPPPTEEKRSLLVLPFHGQPHPDSPGEQLLARFLRRDTELAGLFEFNQPVPTVRGTTHTVDLIWPDGSLIVEVDGYGWHSSLLAFRQDRQRDYELAISGYLVLRLTHDEVMEDVVLAIEKIRDVVAYRRLQRQPVGAY